MFLTENPILDTPGGLYIHIPFCRRKCLYCDFFSGAPSEDLWSRFVDALLAELSERCVEIPRRLQSIYIGGGTPSLMPPLLFERLCSGIRKLTLPYMPPGGGDALEFTLEVNPDDVSMQLANVWKRAGVNRISMGVQSLVDSELRAIGRHHNALSALEAAKILRENFRNVSIDIIFGLPGQSLASLEHTLKGVIGLHPDHISAYALMLEDNTPLTILSEQGRIRLPEDDEIVRMFQLVESMLAAVGYDHYEISNYALPGKRSIHNSSYWTFSPYLGLGPSAHSYDGLSLRRSNPPKIQQYISHFAPSGQSEESDYSDKSARHSPSSSLSDTMRGASIFYSEEKLSPIERLEESIMLGLRTKEGIDLKRISESFSPAEAERLIRKAQSIESKSPGTILQSKDRIAVTKNSLMHADQIIISLLPD
ncbi:MAG: radical SAM family heme chaperone HemW [Clostridium sp.]|nr:radical SAM family heme chaperone HemW [Prevotella sp.]MCM1429648.1 radical SAM family heme chaperone HemW [Clostridium sp.]MCM1474650.1 radical SAM family heme chaperone HemW [Muribaculaceae bacterium]